MLVLRAAVLALLEPQLLGVVVHRAGIEDAVVVDQAFPRRVPDTGDPVRHVAAVARAQRAGAAGVEALAAAYRSGSAEREVLELLAASVAGNGVGEGLPVAGGSVEVDRDDGEALARIRLRIPAIAPAVVARALRAAVDEKGDGIRLAR